MCPVRLGLLARKSFQPQKRFAGRGAQTGHDAAQLADATGVAALADHLKQAGSAQAGMAL